MDRHQHELSRQTAHLSCRPAGVESDLVVLGLEGKVQRDGSLGCVQHQHACHTSVRRHGLNHLHVRQKKNKKNKKTKKNKEREKGGGCNGWGIFSFGFVEESGEHEPLGTKKTEACKSGELPGTSRQCAAGWPRTAAKSSTLLLSHCWKHRRTQACSSEHTSVRSAPTPRMRRSQMLPRAAGQLSCPRANQSRRRREKRKTREVRVVDSLVVNWPAWSSS